MSGKDCRYAGLQIVGKADCQFTQNAVEHLIDKGYPFCYRLEQEDPFSKSKHAVKTFPQIDVICLEGDEYLCYSTDCKGLLDSICPWLDKFTTKEHIEEAKNKHIPSFYKFNGDVTWVKPATVASKQAKDLIRKPFCYDGQNKFKQVTTTTKTKTLTKLEEKAILHKVNNLSL